MKKILIGEQKNLSLSEALLKYGFEPIYLPKLDILNSLVNNHADTLIFSDGKNLIGNIDYINKLPSFLNKKISGVCDIPFGDYPTDTVFNALVIGNILFAKLDSLSPALLAYAKKQGLKICNTKQGYTRCSTIPIGNNYAITADKGVYKILKENGIEALLIESGYIKLKEKDDGFIGGASFVDESQKSIYFFGNISLHPSYSKIIEFTYNIGYECKSLLPDVQLFDIGGGIIID